MTAVLVDPTSHGDLTLNSDGSFTYVPTPGYGGADGFTYQADAEGVLTNIAYVTISVTPIAVNGPPVIAEGETAAVTADEDNSPTPFAFTLNATDPDPGRYADLEHLRASGISWHGHGERHGDIEGRQLHPGSELERW